MVQIEPDVVYDSIMITLSFLVSGALSTYFLYYYSRKKKLPWYIYIVIGFTYWISFSAIFLVTIDVASGLHISTKPHGATTYMRIIWNIIYWSIQLLSWILIPILQSYVIQGHFTWHRKLLGAFIENVILYIIFGVIGAVILIGVIVYIIMHATQDTPFTLNSIFGLCISFSNAFGLTLLVFLLGYGMAQLPLYLWKRARHAYTLALYQFRAIDMFDRMESKKLKYSKYLKEVLKADVSVPVHVQNRTYIDMMANNIAQDAAVMNIRAGDSGGIIKNPHKVTYRQCVKLNSRLIQARHIYQKHAYHWEYLQRKAFYLESVMDAKNQRHGEYRIIDPFRKERRLCLSKPLNILEYFWTTRFHYWAYRLSAILIILFSLVLIWCEFTPLFRQILNNWLGLKDINLSPFYHLIRAFRFSRFLLQLISLLIIAVMSTIMYFGLFKLKFFSLYQLIPHHSDSATLLFTGVFLTRVVPALCFNYLQVTGVTINDGVAFYEVMGALRLEELSFFGTLGGAFQDYFPLIMIFVALVVYLDVFGRVLALCGIKHRFVFQEELDNERIEEGKRLLARQKKFKLRQLSEQKLDTSHIRESIYINHKNTSDDDEDDDVDRVMDDDEDPFATNPLPPSPSETGSFSLSSVGNSVKRLFGFNRSRRFHSNFEDYETPDSQGEELRLGEHYF